MLRILLISCFTVCSIQSLSISRRSYCGGGDSFLTQNNGVISSHAGMANNHTYGHNMDCVWKIEAPEGMMVELVAKSFDLEDDSTCDYDYLMLYDGRDTTSSSLGKFCGTTFTPITSSGRFMTLRFITDGDTQLSGFQIFYNFTTSNIHVCHSSQYQCANGKCIALRYKCDNSDDCGDDSDELNCLSVVTPSGGGNGTCDSSEFNCHTSEGCIPKTWLCDGDDDCGNGVDELTANCISALNDKRCGPQNQTGTSGFVTSPNYPSTYGTDIHCFYFIQAPTDTQGLAFKFDGSFSLEPDSTCDYDYVLVYSGNKINKHGPYCGNRAPAGFTIPGNHAYVEFVADDSDQYSGYRLDWKALEQRQAPASGVKRFLFNTTDGDNPLSTTASSLATSPPKCHYSIRVQGRGQILSPNFGHANYPPRLYCTWELTAPLGQTITLQFADFSLQTSRSCTRDSVRIFNGLDSFSDQLGKFCGPVIPPDVESTGNKMLVFFHSDSGVGDKGFNITYFNDTEQVTVDVFEDDGCNGTPKVLNSSQGGGYISSPGYNGHDWYDSDKSCSWLIEAPEGKIVTIKFEDFLTEKAAGCDYDYLAVYDGINNGSRKITQLCGLQFPEDISSSGRFLFLHFNSDQDVAARGFNLTFEFKNKEAPCNMFRCGEGSCIFEQMVCNKVAECPGGADELICDNGNCGRPSVAPTLTSHKIVGGREAVPHSWPWMISLRANGIHQCGAAIINENWMITAGHCFEANHHAPEWTAAAGKHFEIKSEDTVQIRQVSRIIVYSTYNYLTTNNDIALVKVEPPFNFNENVSAVCLPQEDARPGDSGFVTGWGAVETSCCPGVLKQVMLPIITNAVCNQPDYLGNQVTNNMFCAGYDEGGKDACQGDSGGPFVIEKAGVWHLQGITSFGSGCADVKSPGVYTRVYNYVGWIRQTIALNL